MIKTLIVCLIICLSTMVVGCNRATTNNRPSSGKLAEKSNEAFSEKSDESFGEKIEEDFDEMFADDYLEYPTEDKADDFFAECFEKIEGSWCDGDRTIGFYIDDEDGLYMMSGWTERDRIIAFIDPVRNHENQFEIGLEAGEMQEILRCEIVEENKVILIKDTEYVRMEELKADE